VLPRGITAEVVANLLWKQLAQQHKTERSAPMADDHAGGESAG
jgi:hypothetical protein